MRRNRVHPERSGDANADANWESELVGCCRSGGRSWRVCRRTLLRHRSPRRAHGVVQHRRHDVAVEVHRRLNARMSEAFRDNLRVDPARQHSRRGGVAEIVESHVRQPRAGEDATQGAVHGGGAHEVAEGTREHQTAIDPLRTDSEAMLILPETMFAKRGDRLRREGNPTRTLGLRRGDR